MPNLHISLIENHEDWSKISHEWNNLLAQSEFPTFFLTWEWLSSWAECCLNENRRLFILCFHEKEQLVGIAPFYIQKKKAGPFRVREIRFLGTPEAGSDYLTVFARKGREEAVADALYDHLTAGEGKKDWDQLVLGDMRADSLFLLHFTARIDFDGKYAATELGAYCPQLKLPPSEADLHAMCSARWRKKIKQDLRVINRERAVHHAVSGPQDVSEKLAQFFHLYQVKGGRPVGRLHAILERVSVKHENALPVQVDLLSINDRTVAGLVHLKYQTTVSMYLMAVDKQYNPKVSLGNLLVGQSIKNSIDSGYAVYDFLKGEERYKFHWATGGIRTINVLFWQKKPAPLYSASSRLLKNAGKLLLR